MPRIEIYADVVCPFAYVGLTRLMQKRASLGRDDVHLQIRSWPLELVNNEPVEGIFIGHEIDEIAPQIAPDLFKGFQAANFPASSMPSLALTAAAYDLDDQTGERVAMAVRRALFENGQNVADTAVLQAIAEQYGLASLGTKDQVLSEYARGQERGAVGSPHFFIDDDSQFCPVLDISKVDGHLKVNVDQPAMDELINRCFV
jgi:predicted DsbA family dithiol-disulfide isomerase